MVTVIAGILALVLVAGCGWVLGMGGVGPLVTRLAPPAKLAAFAVVLVLVAATGWTIGSAVGQVGDRSGQVATETGQVDQLGHAR